VLCGTILAIERPINHIASIARVKFPDVLTVPNATALNEADGVDVGL